MTVKLYSVFEDNFSVNVNWNIVSWWIYNMIEHVKKPSRTSLISKDAIETLKEVKYSCYLSNKSEKCD